MYTDAMLENGMSEESSLLEQVDVLVAHGIYKDREAVLEDALRSLLRSKPELRSRLAIELYRVEEVSLSRAAEISGLDLENCKELLREAGVVRRVMPRGEAVHDETEQLLLAREAEPSR
jgi:predicted HTH domain antitoxin